MSSSGKIYPAVGTITEEQVDRMKAEWARQFLGLSPYEAEIMPADLPDVFEVLLSRQSTEDSNDKAD